MASDNRRALCSPCLKRDGKTSSAPPKPEEFWRRPALQDAFRVRHFGQVLYAYRYEHRPVLTQARLGRWLGITQGQVSRLERSEGPINELDKLDAWARALCIPERHLWFRLSEQPHHAYSSADFAPSLVINDANGEDSVRRREMLKVVGLAASGFGWFGTAAAGVSAKRRIDAAEVTMIREMTRTFRSVDNRFGGGHARSAVSNYLSADVVPLLRETWATDRVRADLYGAVAELNQLAGWMAYDTGDSDAGSKHLRQALRLCQDVDDDGRAAEMLAGTSHQAAFFRSGAIAIDLAESARSTAGRSGISALVSESAVMAAHGYALQGHTRSCLDALGESERALAAAEGQERPEWLGYFDSAYLAAKFAHCFRDLGRPVESERYARESLEMSEGYDRGKLFNLCLLASALADQGRAEEACVTASVALGMAGTVRSVRTVAYLADVARRLNRYRSVPEVSALLMKMDLAAIPVPSR
ncbi:helix-turn-helix domain-containing protein [Actinokineospora sp. NBRC 105648]|uniref:helix-turn-helix domain-containing protein n=1 Tax=Actinokineospora sp. NBRC 105648 TaxID=3032206 RepID=UPI0025521A61|nr:helix-turn-helix domain-containing protein [Actinokineospora sp. NBRC 105648]